LTDAASDSSQIALVPVRLFERDRDDALIIDVDEPADVSVRADLCKRDEWGMEIRGG
jgi:hypothetical protein